MRLWQEFWGDEAGAVVSAELVAVGTVAVLGGSVGLNLLAASVNDELKETAYAVRSFDQSYSVAGHVSSRAWKAGSSYTQPDVKKSLEELSDMVGDQPNQPQDQPKKATKKKKKVQKQADDQDEAAFLQADELPSTAQDPVEADDDASRVETRIDAAPEA